MRWPDSAVTAAACFCAFFLPPLFAQQTFTDAQNRLRLHEDAGSGTQTVYSRGTQGITTQIIADGDRYVQKNYDSQMRLIKKIVYGEAKPQPIPQKTTENTAVQTPPQTDLPATSLGEEPQAAESAETASATAAAPAKIETPVKTLAAEDPPPVEKKTGQTESSVPAEKAQSAKNEPPQKAVATAPSYLNLQTPTLITEFFYAPQAKYAQKSVETDFAANLVTETLFSPDNLPLKKTVSAISENDKKPQAQGLTEWTYDEQRRLTKEKTTQGKKTQTVVFSYLQEHVKPDTAHYENGVLTAENRFDKDGALIEEKLYFSGDTVVKVIYENGKRKSETVLNGERIIREKNFE